MRAVVSVSVLLFALSSALGCSPAEPTPSALAEDQNALGPEWAPVASLSRQRAGHTTTLLKSGDALIVGGDSNTGPAASAELFVPDTAQIVVVADMSVARAFHTATALGDGRVLIVGGTDGTTTLSSVELYDPETRSFSLAAPLATPREHHVATRLGDGRVLIAGGGATTTELFDPATGAWSAGPNTSVASTATRLLDGRVLFVGGGDSVPEIFDPAAAAGKGAFVQTGSLVALKAALHTATLLPSGKVLVVGGCPPPPAGCECSSVGGPPVCTSSKAAELFDPAMNGGSGGFLVVASSTVAMRQAHTASLLPSGKVLLTGGGPTYQGTPPTPLASAELYDPATGTFSATTSLGATRAGHTATVLPNGGVLIVGGADPVLLDERVELLIDPGNFAGTGALSAGRTAQSATLLRSGRVLIAGGIGFDANNKQIWPAGAEQYDPTSGAFVASGSMSAARQAHTATPLPDGSVLFAGGVNAAGTSLDSAERFVPGGGAGSFVSAGTLTVPRRGHAATLLPDRSVLVTGGANGSTPLTSAELYGSSGGFVPLAASMTVARAYHAAVLLGTGKVLLVGGSTAELYDPITKTFAATGSPIGVHAAPSLALLSSGDVLVAGQPATVAEMYHPASGTFSATAELVEPIVTARVAHLLPTGNVLLAGGYYLSGGLGVPSWMAELFIPSAGQGKGLFVRTGNLSGVGFGSGSSLLADGRILFAGGVPCTVLCPPTALASAALYADPFDVARRPTLSSVPATLAGGQAATLSGSGFAPPLEASSGNTASSPSNVPVVVWMPESGQGRIVGSVSAFTNAGLTFQLPSTSLHGFGRLFVVVNGIPSVGSVVELLPGKLGAVCADAAACASGFCSDGVCCDSVCIGACRACTAKQKGSGQDGVCGDIPPELDPTDSCPLGSGAPCASALHCASGNCVDGVCCDKPCSGQCEACDEPNALGQCIAVVGSPRGSRPACAPAVGANPCTAQTCDGLQSAACAGLVGAEVECLPASCSDGVALLVATCDGLGSCGAQKSVSCAPSGCAGSACGPASCGDDSDCHPDYRCSKGVGATLGACVLANATECDGEHTLTSADGTQLDCAPYRCTAAGTCVPACESSLDCVRGYACAAAGRCVADSALARSEQGCGCRTVGQRPRPRDAGLWLGGSLMALLWSRRSRRVGSRRA